MKRIISLLLAAVMLLSACIGFQVTALAKTYGDYEFTATDGKAVVTGYTGTEDVIHVPSLFTTDTADEVVGIGDLAFFMQSDIEEIYLPNTVTSVGNSAFHDCSMLKTVELGTGVTSIGAYAFRNCFALKSIHLPASVTSIGLNAFAGTASLATITVDSANTAYTSVDNALFTKDMKSLIRMASKAGVKEYAIPNGVEAVQNFAFDASGVEVLTVPASVTSFGNNVFDDAEIKKIIYQGPKADWDAITIGNNNDVLYDENTEFVFEEEHVHSYTSEITTSATCTEPGVRTFTCSCGDYYTEPVQAAGHQPAAAVKENEVPATCQKEGSYDSVIYCGVCGDEMSREHVIVTKTAHTPASAVRENEVPATYTKEGSYDEVIYCSVCGEELSRRTVTEPKREGKNGWYKVNGKWYLYKDNEMLKYWQKDNGKWYYMNSKGEMVTGWLKIKNVWYYLGVGGDMATGWRYINKKWYYFATSGAMQTGWVKDGGKWYYLESSGAMLVSTSKKIGSKTYRFDGKGVCLNP